MNTSDCHAFDYPDSWHDSMLDSIKIEYNSCTINFTDYNDVERVISCVGFSGIEYLGQYEENVIQSIKPLENSNYVTKVKTIIKESNSNYTDSELKVLEILLIDNVKIIIVAREFVLSTVPTACEEAGESFDAEVQVKQR